MLLPRRLMPSVPELVAFEAAARHQNFSAAAEELSLTQGAISKQIRNMEMTLGVSLFDRRRKRLIMTRQAKSILPSVISILEQIAGTTYRVLSSGDGENTLSLHMFSTFSSRWLIPRLPRLMAQCPQLKVNITTVFEPFSFDGSDCDIAVHYGAPVWPDGQLHHLFDETIVPVCSPAYRDAAELRTSEDLARASLIQLTTRPALWDFWFAQVNVTGAASFKGHVFDQFNATIEAAMAGIGVALVPTIFVERELAEGTLCVVSQETIRSRGAYYVVTPVEKAHDPAISAFIRWICAESAAYGGLGIPAPGTLHFNGYEGTRN
ncbi:LysR substrate-binding domain-containing protein [Gluconacetobacter sp. Hr-1-5]|uniref:LysR substrate-binding domain-containing protein n=1 Tax=Gluconacetobacter sp. Hr-1-5 TaxID=3395370 RepID=UPI003B51A051